MIPTAPIASSIGTSGVCRGNASGASIAPVLSGLAKGTGARSAAFGRARLAAAITATLAALLLTFAAQALATTGHTFAGQFGGLGNGEGQFGEPLGNGPAGVAVMASTGEVFTVDVAQTSQGVAPRVQLFGEAGVFASTFALDPSQAEGGPSAVAVDPAGSGAVYVATGANGGVPTVAKYSTTGALVYTLDASTSGTSINSGAQVAVDPADGTVYVTASNNTFAQVIDSFDQSTGAFIASFNGESGSPDGGFVCPSSIAVDPTHHLYILDPCKGRVDKYSSTGTWEATIDDGSRGAPQAIATDPSTGEVYVAEAGPLGLQITNFAAGGASVIYTFEASNVAGVRALALSGAGTLYTSDATAPVVERFTSFLGPTVTTTAAGEVKRTSATFNGTIDPEGIATEYHYQYGLENTYGSSTAEIDAGSGSAAIEAPGPVTGLIPNTTYHYRIVGSNASGEINGEDQTLTSAAAPPSLDGSPAFASAITPSGARVHASVNPEHSLSSFRIEYGTSTAYGSSTPEGGGEVGEQSSDQVVAATLTGLAPGTLYHYRVSAENGVEGPQLGADATFITAPAAAASAGEVTSRKATLSGTIDPHGVATTYHFNYGPSTAYGASTPEADGGSASGEQTVAAHISGLSPSTTYHVQVIATSGGISYSGADGSFTTRSGPGATVSDPIAVTTDSAMLQGAADTNGLSGSYHFEVSATEGSYATSTSEQPLPAATGAQPVSAPVSGLPPGQKLNVRLVVRSNEVTDVSEAAFFTTAPLPPEGFPTPPAASSVYGCNAPKLDPFNRRPAPGSTIAISGSDLGMAGSVLLGEDSLIATSWSSSGFTIEVPADATGTLGLSVNCGRASNTIAIATSTARLPSNDFSTGKATVKGSTATLSVTLPGPGKLQASAAKTKGATLTVAKAGTRTLKLSLSRAGVKALSKAKRRTLAVKVQLRFTPTGGQPATRTATLSFKGKRGH